MKTCEKITDIFKKSTSTEDIASALKERLDVVGQIMNDMMTDDENDSKKLLCIYQNSSPEERGIMDYVLVCLCGYTMHSVIENAKETGNILPI